MKKDKDLNKEDIKLYMDFQKAIEKEQEKTSDYIDELAKEDIADDLKDFSTPLTRGEKKKFKEKDIEIAQYQFRGGDYDDYLDALIEIRNVAKADDMRIPDLVVWLDTVLGRTLYPLKFEGN